MAMRIADDTSDRAVLSELGKRLARYRLNKNLTQATLAAQAGVSLPTIQRIEKGSSTQASNLIRVLRALKLLRSLDSLIPEPPVSPIQQAKLRGRQRRRASSPSDEKTRQPSEWTWGDDA